MEEQRKITINEISKEGHTEHSLLPADALTFVNRKIQEEGKWGFINGEFINTETLTEEDLLEADHILLTNKLEGGEITYKTTIKIGSIEKDDMGDVLVDVDDETITIFIDKEYIGFVTRNITSYCYRLHQWLIAKARKEVAQIAHMVGQTFEANYPDDEVPEAALVGIKVSEDQNLPHAMTMIYTADTDELEVVINPSKKYPLLHARDYIVKTLHDKVLEYGKENVELMKQAVNY